MVFSHIVQSFIGGAVLLIFLLAPVMDADWAPSIQSEPILPKKYHRLYYLFLFILYFFSIVYFWRNKRFEYVTGLGSLIAFCIWVIFAKTSCARKQKSQKFAEIKKKGLEEKDEYDFPITKLIPAVAIGWLAIWLGSFIPWKGYLYYTFMKFSGTIIAICMAEISYNFSKVFFLIFVLIAVIFNPILPFKFEKEIWHYIDICTLIVIAIFYFEVRRRKQEI